MSFKELLPGVAQGITITVVGHPLDTIKTRLQSGMYPTMVTCVNNTIKNEGMFGLYRGVSVPMISHVIKRSYQFPIFNHLRSDFNVPIYLAGAMAGVSGTIIGNPLQVIKVNIQSTKKDKYKNAFDFVKQHYKKKGLRGFYKGFRITLLKDMTFGGSFYGNYTLIKNALPDKPYSHFFAGGITHSINWLLFIPIDYTKTQIQKSEGKLTIKDVVTKTVKDGGYKRLWRGIVPAITRIFPVSGCGMMAYEFVYGSLINKH